MSVHGNQNRKNIYIFLHTCSLNVSNKENVLLQWSVFIDKDEFYRKVGLGVNYHKSLQIK